MHQKLAAQIIVFFAAWSITAQVGCDKENKHKHRSIQRTVATDRSPPGVGGWQSDAESERQSVLTGPQSVNKLGEVRPRLKPTPPQLLVAFIGDQGNNKNSDAVLRLIKSEGAQATVHNGDFDYESDPHAWEERINRILGSNYPYFAVVGNHDAGAWAGPKGYADYIAKRHARVKEMHCGGELGIRANCYFRGLHMVQSCIGTYEVSANCAANSVDQVQFIKDSLQWDQSIWSICAWHKNQNDMQIGGKKNEVGWRAYRACMNGGAIVITGHEHSYARTLTLTDLGNAQNAHGKIGRFDEMRVARGSNFVLVSGLAGYGIRRYRPAQHDDDTWWASFYAANTWMKNGVPMVGKANFGALFIEFNVDGDPARARGYFKDIAGRVADEFHIQRN